MPTTIEIGNQTLTYMGGLRVVITTKLEDGTTRKFDAIGIDDVMAETNLADMTGADMDKFCAFVNYHGGAV